MENLKDIIAEIKGYKLKCSDDTILTCSTQIFINTLDKKEVIPERTEYIGVNPKATDKQIKYLKALGYTGNTNKLNKLEARALIEKLKK